MAFSNVDLLESISAEMALETPQILLTWTYIDNIPEVTNIKIQRSTFRFPESSSEGTTVLNEAFDADDPRTTFSDTTVVKDTVYYYSIFFTHYGAFSLAQTKEQDIERLGELRGIHVDQQFVNETIFTPNGFLTNFTGNFTNLPIVPGSISMTTDVGTITDDALGNLIGAIGVGANTINYTTGAFDVTWSSAPTTGGDVDYDFYPDNKYWILARDNDNIRLLWLYDSKIEMAGEGISLEPILNSGEVLVSIAWLTGESTAATSREAQIVTDSRMFKIVFDTMDETVTSISSEVLFTDILDPGFRVTGSTNGESHTTNVYILDAENKNIKFLSDTGSILRTIDLTGLIGVNDKLRGLVYSHDTSGFFADLIIGNNKVFFGFNPDVTSPIPSTHIKSLFPVRQKITADPDLKGSLALTGDLITVSNDLGIFETYNFVDLISTDVQIEESALSRQLKIIGLFHFDDEVGATTTVDTSGLNNDASVEGDTVSGVVGRFNNGFEFPNIGSYVDMTATAGDIDAVEGSFEFWYKLPYAGYTPTSVDRLLVNIIADANNRIQLYLNSDDELVFEVAYQSNVDSVVVANASTVLSDKVFRHIFLRWDPDLTIWIDSVSSGTSTTTSTFSGSPEIFLGDGDSGSSAVGFYDDVRIAANLSTSFARYTLETRGNRAWALAGRDYDDTEAFSLRNEMRKYFSEFVIRNDFQQEYLPEGKVIEDGQLLFRETRDIKETLLGHLGRTSRMFGLLLDRNVDRRRFFMDHLTASESEFEFIPQLGEVIEAIDFDEDWNVDVRRRFLETTWFTNQRKGTINDAFKRMARFLGFRLWCPDGLAPVVVSRRKFDSVVDPAAQDTPFDTSVFDSFDSTYPFVIIEFTFFKDNFISSVGATSVPATRELTDAGATFTQTAQVGSLLTVYDVDDMGDNAQYMVSSVTSDTVLVVDRDFLEGSNTGLDYTLSWQVPCDDPYGDTVLGRFKPIKARWQSLICTNVSP